jgi:fatty-acyl-CoA synthase
MSAMGPIAVISIVGIPDRDWGEVPVGFVQIKPGHEVAEQELSEFCRVRLASYKVPRIWRFVEQFPQTASSKIQKYVLRELYLAEMAPFHQIKGRTPLLKPKLRLPHGQLQVLAVL